MLSNGSLTNVKYPKSILSLENQVDIKRFKTQTQPNPSLLPHIKSTRQPPPPNTIVITRSSPILITKHNYVHQSVSPSNIFSSTINNTPNFSILYSKWIKSRLAIIPSQHQCWLASIVNFSSMPSKSNTIMTPIPQPQPLTEPLPH